ncbi:efflux RND transporter periplasmic adaptor subunit [Pantoea sp. BJFS-204]|uniref:efflux RND transporter periplasmic adaptor subunit n=1 Tax=Pantoea sp. BJFS-204 TaxID=3404823 RepID=UPI003BB4E1FA
MPGRNKAVLGSLLLAVFLLAGSCLIIGFHDRNEPGETGSLETWLPVNYAPVSKFMGLAGHIEAEEDVTLSAPFDGVISKVGPAPGSRVKASTLIFAIDPAQLEVRIRTALSDQLKAQSEVNRLEHWMSSPEITRLRRQINIAAAELGDTQANLHETKALYERGIVARSELDALRMQVRTQAEELQNSRDALAQALSDADGNNMRIAQMVLLNAKTQYNSLVSQAARKEVRAPFDGLLLPAALPGGAKSLNAIPGQQVMQGAPVFNLTRLDRFLVRARVQEGDVRFLKEGMNVKVTSDGLPGEKLSGKIIRIASQPSAKDEASGTITYDVIASLNFPPETLGNVRLGMSADVQILTYSDAHGMVLPAQSIKDDGSGNSYVVYREKTDTKPRRVFVTLKETVPAGIVVEGLLPGEILIPSLQ